MATAAENLQTRYNAIAAILAAGQTPDGQSLSNVTVNIDGEQQDTDKYVQRLYDELARINEALGHAAASGGPTATVISQVMPR
ncbi:hypothetical protein Pan241w_11260 [Gimesia alba]|uniref:Uncharacterized protein n=1 Tax=Gimesia alba TaxID=2527973 RepID=A0A517RB08_9PLAN|nr:hypothetical protein [Gimesia alba]QDT41067.1 hypothetical protein Pan241w_11260 [Gimesia alba]